MKILKSYRFEQETIDKLEKLMDIYQERLNASGIKSKFTMTDVLETLINKEYEAIKELKENE